MNSNLNQIYSLLSAHLEFQFGLLIVFASHKAFLLLSRLCSSSRYKLDEYYNEFINWMTEHWMLLEIDQDNVSQNLFLPNDLFEMNITLNNPKNFALFLKFIKNLKKHEGWYSNQHYMYSHVKFGNYVKIDFSLIEKLHPELKTLKSIKVDIRDRRDNHMNIGE